MLDKALLRLKTLGGLSLWRGAELVAVAGAPAFALHLLAILGFGSDRAVASGDVIALLWPELPAHEGNGALGALVTALPEWLDGTQPVHFDRDAIHLDPALITSDARDFEFTAASGAPGEAARLYTGPFLLGVTAPTKPFERWREREASRLAQVARWCQEAARARPESPALGPGVRVGHGGRYRIERELGAGAAATVYLAYDTKHDRPVAIKALRQEISETISPERFEHEIKFVAQLQHPHILPLFDSGDVGGVLYSVMPYVPGETVRQQIDREGTFPVDDAVRIAAEVADALAHAHEHGVLHRDVKPENILLSDGHALLADFGIALAIDDNSQGRTTLPGVVLGTMPYMSPEQATGAEHLDGRADVYSVGAVLHEMLAGAPPFAGETPRRMMARRLSELPPPLSAMNVQVPPSVQDALSSALQPAVANRATARQLADSLELAGRHLTEESRALKVKRSRRPLFVGAIVLAALVALIFVSRCAGAQTPDRLGARMAPLQQLLVAEDSRGTGTDGIAPLLAGATSSDTLLRRVAVRALGRLQRPGVDSVLVDALGDAMPAVRREAANALAQSVQSVPVAVGADSARQAVARVRQLLASRLAGETDASVAGAIAQSLGRLPVFSTEDVHVAERALVGIIVQKGGAAAVRSTTSSAVRDTNAIAREWRLDQVPVALVRGVTDGLYSLARLKPPQDSLSKLKPTNDSLSAITVQLLTAAAKYAADGPVRRHATLALGTLHASSSGRQAACDSLITNSGDQNPHVMLAAIDALGRPCASPPSAASARTAALRGFAEALPAGDVARVAGHVSWHAAAHALVSIARGGFDSVVAPLLPRFSSHPRAQVREYAAQAATHVRDAGTLQKLTSDPDHNVQAAALGGLVKLSAHAADSVYNAALSSRGYQVVMAASAALSGSPSSATVPALLDAFDRVSAERRENARDPRMELLARLDQLGAPANASRLEPYLADFDTTVAARVAGLLTKWNGHTVAAHPKPLRIRPEPLAETFGMRGLQLRITMAPASGGGSFAVRLFPDDAPATVARVVRLARARYYDGLTFHRVVPGFVIQGGSPDANEYVGDAAFMRDELGLRSHDRGTLGISTRGRDTGDAQLFVNLVDNPRLDHDYTVFGEVVSGMEVVDGVLEGDVIASVQVLAGRPSPQRDPR